MYVLNIVTYIFNTDTNIEFRLAKIDPNGDCTQGVTRTYSSLT